ncbi:MAG: hemerythrin domain-containing protein [bacterium]
METETVGVRGKDPMGGSSAGGRGAGLHDGRRVETSRRGDHLERFVKDIVGEYPRVGEILESFGIGCVSCSVGTCKLKDVVEYHYLEEGRKRRLTETIERVITGGGEVGLEPRAEDPAAGAVGEAGAAPLRKEFKYSPPMKRLVDEHVVIKRWAALIPELAGSLDLRREDHRRLAAEGIDFIRSFADGFHHAKEEEILFGYFDEGLDILKVMREDHRAAGERVRGMAEALGKLDTEAFAEHLRGYAALLDEHIKKEDEILYPWMDGQLTTRLVGEINERFREADALRGEDLPVKYGKFVERAEKFVKGKGV